MRQYPLIKRPGGKYEEHLDGRWVAEYFEDRDSGLWQADVYHHDVSVWRSQGFNSLEEAQQAARAYCDQQ